jgi:hypothetical protein
MLGSRQEQEILGPIVRLVVIHVVDGFVSSEYPTELLFHNQSVFQDISLHRVRMIGLSHKDVPKSVDVPARSSLHTSIPVVTDETPAHIGQITAPALTRHGHLSAPRRSGFRQLMAVYICGLGVSGIHRPPTAARASGRVGWTTQSGMYLRQVMSGDESHRLALYPSPSSLSLWGEWCHTTASALTVHSRNYTGSELDP